MLKITLPDGSIREFEKNVSVKEVAESIGSRLAKESVAGKVNGILVDASFVIEKDSSLEIITLSAKEGAEIVRHSSAHVMAQAVVKLFPGTKVTIGPAIENGFYYDFDSEHKFSEEDLLKIEEEMKNIAKADYSFVREDVSKEYE